MVQKIDIPEIIKRARAKLGMSQVEFGSIVGVTAQTVKNWEQGRGFPNKMQFEIIGQLANIQDPDEEEKINWKKALVTGGVAFGLFLILKKIFEEDQ